MACVLHLQGQGSSRDHAMPHLQASCNGASLEVWMMILLDELLGRFSAHGVESFQLRILCIEYVRAIAEGPWCFSLYINRRFIARFCIIQISSSWL